MNLTLCDISSNRVSEIRRNIEQARLRNGGIESIIYHVEAILKNLFSFAVATISFVYIFSLHEPIEQKSFWTEPWSMIILLLLVVVFTLLSFFLQTKQNAKISDLNQQANEANSSAFAYMQLISDNHFGKDIRVYKLKSFLCNFFSKLWESSIGYKLTKKLGKKKALIPCITSILDSILTFFIYILVLMKAVVGNISSGSAVMYIGNIQIFTRSIMDLVNSVGELIGFGELLNPYIELLEIPEEANDVKNTQLPQAPYKISFENVSFKYPDSDDWVLKDVNFTLNDSEKTAFVGINGSGKSTAIKLLCRFYEPQKGKITLNGFNISDFTITQYRKLISAVFQDFSLTSFQLGQNIACTQEYDKQNIYTAINRANLSEWIEKHEENINIYLHKNFNGAGIEISGGEAQKIAIARAIYKNGALFILDEPTAALDPRAEADVYENIGKIVSDRTAVYISHRLASCRFCDHILVFDNGHVIQMGTHEQLVNQKGQYQNLWKAQAQFYKI